MMLARSATWLRSARFMPAVTARNSGASPGGSMVTNSVTTALYEHIRVHESAYQPPVVTGKCGPYDESKAPAGKMTGKIGRIVRFLCVRSANLKPMILNNKA
jgi:hypothetical protein